jgi:hypothetical protein
VFSDKAGMAYEKARESAECAEQWAMSIPRSAPDSQHAHAWGVVACAWAAVGNLAVLLVPLEPAIVDELPDAAAQEPMGDTLETTCDEIRQLAERLNASQRIIGEMMRRLDIDSIAIPSSEWDAMEHTTFTMTVTGDNTRVVRRVS